MTIENFKKAEQLEHEKDNLVFWKEKLRRLAESIVKSCPYPAIGQIFIDSLKEVDYECDLIFKKIETDFSHL